MAFAQQQYVNENAIFDNSGIIALNVLKKAEVKEIFIFYRWYFFDHMVLLAFLSV